MELTDSVLILYQNGTFYRYQSRRISLSYNGSITVAFAAWAVFFATSVDVFTVFFAVLTDLSAALTALSTFLILLADFAVLFSSCFTLWASAPRVLTPCLSVLIFLTADLPFVLGTDCFFWRGFLTSSMLVSVCCLTLAIAFVHIDKVKYLDVIPLVFEHIARITKQFTLWVKHDKGSVRLHNVRFCVKPGFTSTRTAAHQNIQVPPMLSSVKSDCRVLRKNLVFRHFPIHILFPF